MSGDNAFLVNRRIIANRVKMRSSRKINRTTDLTLSTRAERAAASKICSRKIVVSTEEKMSILYFQRKILDA